MLNKLAEKKNSELLAIILENSRITDEVPKLRRRANIAVIFRRGDQVSGNLTPTRVLLKQNHKIGSL